MGGEDLSAFDFDPQAEDASITPQKGPIRSHPSRRMGQSNGRRQVQAANDQAAPKKNTPFTGFMKPAGPRQSHKSNGVGSGAFFNGPRFEGPKQLPVRTNGKGLSQAQADRLRNDSDDVEELLFDERSKPGKRRAQGAAAATGQRHSERLKSERPFKGENGKDDVFGAPTYQRKAKHQGGRREAEEQRGREGPGLRNGKRDRESDDEGGELELPPSKRKKAEKDPEYKPNGRSAQQRAPEKQAEPQVIHLDSEDTPQKEKPENTEPQVAEPRRLIPEDNEDPGPSAQVPSEDPSCSYLTARCWLGKFEAHRCHVFFDAARLKIRVPPEFVQGGKESMTFTWDLRDLAPGKSFLQQTNPEEVVVLAFHFNSEVHPALASFLDPKSQALPPKYVVVELDSQEWRSRYNFATWPHELREHYHFIKEEEVSKYTDDRPVTKKMLLDPKAEQKRQAAAIASSHYSTRSSRHEKPTITTFHFPAGDPDAVTLSSSDLARLAPQEFLNDTLIDFYIKFLQVISDTQTARIHFLNSFFFKKLMETAQEAKKRGVKREEAFKRMNKWTRKVDIFDMDYVIIPVNQSLHWSLAILVYPGGGDFPDAKPMGKALARTPCILQLDSMAGGHSNVEDLLRLYLTELWLASYPEETRPSNMREPLPRFSRAVMPFIPVKVPQQDNHCDCGLFLLHYVEQFIQQPPPNFDHRQGTKRSLYGMNPQWFQVSEVTGRKRGFLQELIVRLAQQLEQGDASILERDSLRALWYDIVGGRNENGLPAQGSRQEGDSEQEKGGENKLNGRDMEAEFDRAVDPQKGTGLSSWTEKAAKSSLPNHVFEDAARGDIEDEAREHPISFDVETTPQKRKTQKEESPEDPLGSEDPLVQYRRYLGERNKAEKDAPETSGRDDHVSETDEEMDVQTERKRVRSESGASEMDGSDKKRARSESTEREKLKARVSYGYEFFGGENGAVGAIREEEAFARQRNRGGAISAEDPRTRADLQAGERGNQEEVPEDLQVGDHPKTNELGGVPVESETGWFGEAPAEEKCAADSKEVKKAVDVNGDVSEGKAENSRNGGGREGAGNVRGLQEESMPMRSDALREGGSLEEKEEALGAEERENEAHGKSNETTGSDEPRISGRKGQHRRSSSLGGLEGGPKLHDRIAASVAQAVRGDENCDRRDVELEKGLDGQGRRRSPQKEARGLAPFLEAEGEHKRAADRREKEEVSSPAGSECYSAKEAFLDEDADLHRETMEGEDFVESGRGGPQVKLRSTDEILQRVRRPTDDEQFGRQELEDEIRKRRLDGEASPVLRAEGIKPLTKEQDQRLQRVLRQLDGKLADSNLAEQTEAGLEGGTRVSQIEEKKIDRFRRKAVARIFTNEAASQPALRRDVQLLQEEACRSELGDEDGLTLTGAQRKLEHGHVFERRERDQEPVSQEFSEEHGHREKGSASPGHEADSGGSQGVDSWASRQEGSPQEQLEREEKAGKNGWGVESSSLGTDTSIDKEKLFQRVAARAKESMAEKEKHSFPPLPDLPFGDCPVQAEPPMNRSPSEELDEKLDASDDDECAIIGARFRSTPHGQQKATKVGAGSRGRSPENGSAPERSLRNTRHASERAKSLANGKGSLVEGGFLILKAANGKGKARDANTENEDVGSEQYPEESQEWQKFLSGKARQAAVDDSGKQEASSPERPGRDLKDLCRQLESDGTQGERKETPSKGPKLSNEVDEKDWGSGGLSPDGRKKSLRKLYKETAEVHKETPELEASELLRKNIASERDDSAEPKTPREDGGKRLDPREKEATLERDFVDLVDSDDEEKAQVARGRETVGLSSGEMSSAERKRRMEELQQHRSQTVSRRQARMLLTA